ncbi:YbaN family protein [Chloroflexota bacterium]
MSYKSKTLRGWVRILLITAGTFFVGLGIIGILVPILPTTPFLLLAAVCYGRSSQRFYDWLLNNKWLGSYIKNYLQGRGIPLRVKVITVTLIWVTIGCSVVFLVQILAARVVLLLIATGVSIYILSRRTYK